MMKITIQDPERGHLAPTFENLPLGFFVSSYADGIIYCKTGRGSYQTLNESGTKFIGTLDTPHFTGALYPVEVTAVTIRRLR